MTRFVAVVDVPAPQQAVWDRLTDWPSHTRWVPLTQVRVTTPLATGVGARFVGRTSLAAVGLDRLGFDDPMEVTQWLPPADGLPGRCGIRKLGRLVRGSAAFDVVALPERRRPPAHPGAVGGRPRPAAAPPDPPARPAGLARRAAGLHRRAARDGPRARPGAVRRVSPAARPARGAGRP